MYKFNVFTSKFDWTEAASTSSSEAFLGTVTSVSVASSNGFAGTVADASTTPVITLTTSITGVLKGNGTAISAATAGSDYAVGSIGLAGGQTIAGSTLTTENLTLRANAADLTTGQVNVTSSKEATNTTTASVAIAGGLAVAKRIYALDLTVTNTITGTTSGNLVSGGALGTPSSGTLTNATGLPIAGLEASTSTAIGVGSVELGHASDTTITRVSAGVIAVESVTVPTISSTSTLTNKRITQRVVTTDDDATAVIDVDVTDQYQLTAVANATTFSTTGTPTAGQKLMIRFKDAGVSKGLTWDAVFRAIGVTLPTATTVSKTQYVGCVYNLTDTKWDVLAVGLEA